MNFLVILRGPPASGKTTIAKKLCDKLSAYYISGDKILHEYGFDKINSEGLIGPENFLKANRIIAPEAIRNLDEGKIVVFDGNFYSRNEFTDLIGRIHYEYYVFTIKKSLSECIERDKKREHVVGAEKIKRIYNNLERDDYGTVIGTEKKSAVECAEEIISFLPSEK